MRRYGNGRERKSRKIPHKDSLPPEMRAKVEKKERNFNKPTKIPKKFIPKTLESLTKKLFQDVMKNGKIVPKEMIISENGKNKIVDKKYVPSELHIQEVINYGEIDPSYIIFLKGKDSEKKREFHFDLCDFYEKVNGNERSGISIVEREMDPREVLEDLVKDSEEEIITESYYEVIEGRMVNKTKEIKVRKKSNSNKNKGYRKIEINFYYPFTNKTGERERKKIRKRIREQAKKLLLRRIFNTAKAIIDYYVDPKNKIPLIYHNSKGNIESYPDAKEALIFDYKNMSERVA